MKAIIGAIHGILTNQTDASWPDRLDAWLYQRDPELRVVKKEYRAGPFPRWNCWVKDPLLARSLANELELFCTGQEAVSSNQWSVISNQRSGGRREAERWWLRTNSPPIWLIAHSNGAVIALLVTKRLIARGYSIGGLILSGAACEADIYRNGIYRWYCELKLGAAIAYSSVDDEVVAGDARAPKTWWWKVRDWIWGKMMRPYGCLGRTGWLANGRPLEADGASRGDRAVPEFKRLFTRWFAGGHGAYFKEENREGTFERIYRDVVRGAWCVTGELKRSAEVLLSRTTHHAPRR